MELEIFMRNRIFCKIILIPLLHNYPNSAMKYPIFSLKNHCTPSRGETWKRIQRPVINPTHSNENKPIKSILITEYHIPRKQCFARSWKPAARFSGTFSRNFCRQLNASRLGAAIRVSFSIVILENEHACARSLAHAGWPYVSRRAIVR